MPQATHSPAPSWVLRKVFIVLVTLYAVLMMLHWPIGFTFFTQLSNLFTAAVTLGQLITGGRSRGIELLKYAAAVSITVTFFVFLLVLAPLDPRGIPAAYAQDHCASLCMHLINPVLTVGDFLADSRSAAPLRKSHIFMALVPPVGYFAFILCLDALGFRWNGMTAPYLFLNYEAPAGWFGFLPETAGFTTLGIGVFYVILILLFLFLLVGRGLYTAAEAIRRRAQAHSAP